MAEDIASLMRATSSARRAADIMHSFIESNRENYSLTDIRLSGELGPSWVTQTSLEH